MIRRPLGGGGSGGMGGGPGGSGGGGLLRTVHRAVRGASGSGATQKTTSSSNKNNNNNSSSNRSSSRAQRDEKPISTGGGGTGTLSASPATVSSPFTSFDLPLSPTFVGSASPSWPCYDSSSSPTYSEVSDWECVDRNVFGPVPSEEEVDDALSALQQFLEPAPIPHLMNHRFMLTSERDEADQASIPSGSMQVVVPKMAESDWMEPSMYACSSKVVQPYGANRVYEAFSLLQTEPSVQRMVKSLSSDKAVWNAVLNNEAVREVKDLIEKDLECMNDNPKCSKEPRNPLSWILAVVKAKVMEMLDKLTSFLNELFQPREGEKAGTRMVSAFEEKLRISLFLSIVVLLLVAVGRSKEV